MSANSIITITTGGVGNVNNTFFSSVADLLRRRSEAREPTRSTAPPAASRGPAEVAATRPAGVPAAVVAGGGPLPGAAVRVEGLPAPGVAGRTTTGALPSSTASPVIPATATVTTRVVADLSASTATSICPSLLEDLGLGCTTTGVIAASFTTTARSTTGRAENTGDTAEQIRSTTGAREITRTASTNLTTTDPAVALPPRAAGPGLEPAPEPGSADPRRAELRPPEPRRAHRCATGAGSARTRAGCPRPTTRHGTARCAAPRSGGRAGRPRGGGRGDGARPRTCRTGSALRRGTVV